jgi:hypothetical protein
MAKLETWPHWPAKILKVFDNDKVEVRFFGDHNRATLSVKNCYWFSHKHSLSKQGKSQKNYYQSMDEMIVHISKLTKLYGRMMFPPDKTIVNLKNPYVYIEKFRNSMSYKQINSSQRADSCEKKFIQNSNRQEDKDHIEESDDSSYKSDTVEKNKKKRSHDSSGETPETSILSSSSSSSSNGGGAMKKRPRLR